MTLTILLSLLLSIPSDLAVEGLSDITFSSELGSFDYFNPDEYYINPGDRIWIAFPGGLPFSGSDEAVSSVIFSISLNGILNIPTMPLINTKNMTLQELQDQIESFFAQSYRGMMVSIGLARSAGFQIPVTGQVETPGFIVANGLTRLSSALNLAGGVTPTGAITDILLVDVYGDSSFYNLNDFFSLGDLSANPLVKRNSRIHVSSIRSAIIIEGALVAEISESANSQLQSSSPINFRRIVEFIPGESAREAIERVGGVSPNVNLDACFIERQLSDSLIDSIVFSLNEGTPVVYLEPGDRLIVPSIPNYINVTGQVIKPLPVLYSSGMTANYYIGMAGGFNSLARRGNIKLIFANGDETDIDLNSIIPPGSTIEVSRVVVQFWEEYLTILTGVATVVIAYQSIFSN